MIDREIISKIEKLVYAKPRTIQEIAKNLNKNWRTVDRYVNEIKNDFGTIDVRIFREGTRGALKIVYWTGFEQNSKNSAQKYLEDLILTGRKKEDFSSFDIFQFVNENKRSAIFSNERADKDLMVSDLIENLLLAKKQIISFSGDLSFINYSYKNKKIIDLFESLVKKGVSVKVICRVDIAGKDNIEELLSINYKVGKEKIEIRHREQPLRGMIIDDNFFRLKEIKHDVEKNRNWFVYYNIKDSEWIDWLNKIFWKMFSMSINAKDRIKILNDTFYSKR